MYDQILLFDEVTTDIEEAGKPIPIVRVQTSNPFSFLKKLWMDILGKIGAPEIFALRHVDFPSRLNGCLNHHIHLNGPNHMLTYIACCVIRRRDEGLALPQSYHAVGGC